MKNKYFQTKTGVVIPGKHTTISDASAVYLYVEGSNALHQSVAVVALITMALFLEEPMESLVPIVQAV